MTDHLDVPALVIGGGLAGLNAARELAKAGIPPLLIEARRRVGGLVFGDDLGGVAVDLGAESFAKRSRYTASLGAELGLHVSDPAGRSWIWSHAGGGHAFPIPQGILGIPLDLDDPDVTPLPPHTPAHRARVARLAGAWFAGTGIAAVLPQAADAARRLADGLR